MGKEHELTLPDGSVIDTLSSIHFSKNGDVIARLEPMGDRIPEAGHGANSIRKDGTSTKMRPTAELARLCARYDAKLQANAIGRPVTFRDTDGSDRRVLMDLGVADVHIPGQMAGAAAGYHPADGIADVIAPVVMSAHQKDSIPIWDATNAFRYSTPTVSTPGADVPTASITLGSKQFSTKSRALSFVLPVEVIENADSPLAPYDTGRRAIQDDLRKARELRVCTAALTAANWDSSVVTDLGAAYGWVTGASADPVKDIQNLVLASAMTDKLRLVMDEPTWMAFQRHPAVQKFNVFKSDVPAFNTPDRLSALLELPPITVQKMKFFNTSNVNTYVMAQAATSQSKTGGVVLVRDVAGISDPTEISSMKTVRWSGGTTSDGTIVAGWLVRAYFDPRKGPRGSYVIVVAHNDDEIFPVSSGGALVGGIITGTGQ